MEEHTRTGADWDAADAEEYATVTPSTPFLCDDGKIRTWFEMVDGIDFEFDPMDKDIDEAEKLQRYRDLTFVFGADRIG